MSSLPTLPGVDDAALYGLVPEVYAEFRPVVAEVIAYFVAHLSPARLSALLAEQAALPPDADVRLRLVRLLQAAPALHKLGQVLARRRELDPALRQHLQELETLAPTRPADDLHSLLHAELGAAIRSHRIHLGRRALAEGSVAVVVPLTYLPPDAPDPAPRQGVVKIVKPRITSLLQEDLDLLAGVCDLLDAAQRQGRFAELGFREVFEQVRELLTSEVRLDGEQQHLRAAATLFRTGGVRVPALLPFSTPRATAMERVAGTRITNAVAAPSQRRRWADQLLRSLVGDAIFTTCERPLFHGDPHAGNLVVDPSGRITVIDWSLAGGLSLRDRRAFAQVMAGAIRLDPLQICAALEELAASPPPATVLRDLVARELRRLSLFRPPDLDWAMNLLDAAALAGVRFGHQLMLFRKAYYTLEGVLWDLCPECRPADLLAAVALERFAGDWPWRAVRPPWSRDYATHLSTADLAALLASGPRVATEYWRRAWTR